MRNLYEQCLKLTQFAAMEFEEIFQFSQERLKQALETELIENGYAVRKQRGFLYAEGTVPVLLVAHLDTVHRTQPETICYSADGTVMMSPQGIGGDDRAGVYMILRLIQRVHCHALFCEDEETGGHGARAFTKSGIKPDVNYIVELDRMGSNDAVFYNCMNEQFEQHICSFGFQTAFGSFSDISILAPHLNLAAVNLSTGYYHAHQLGEYVRLDKVEKLISRVEKLLQKKTERFPYASKPMARKLNEPDGLRRKQLTHCLIRILSGSIIRMSLTAADILWTSTAACIFISTNTTAWCISIAPRLSARTARRQRIRRITHKHLSRLKWRKPCACWGRDA